MPIDRESTLKQAEKLHREGRLDLAIAEYARLVEEQPHDWNSINALGDLYLRSGKVDRAVAQFIQIADHCFGEGFLPKAAAVYKKALKAKPDHEHAIARLADIAVAQELMVDARAHLRRLWELRSERGDDRGAADCLIRLASLPEADVETRLTGARAAQLLGDTQRAVELLGSAAEDLEQAGRHDAALDVLEQVAALDASDAGLRRELASKYLAAGQLEEAGRLLDLETAGSDPELMLALASLELARQNDGAAWAALTRFIGLVPERFADVLRLAGELGRAGEPDRAFGCAAVVVDEAVLRGDWDRAIDVLQSFVAHGRHIPALVTLVQVAEEAGVEEVLHDAQERLVEAYREQGLAVDAQSIADALRGRARPQAELEPAPIEEAPAIAQPHAPPIEIDLSAVIAALGGPSSPGSPSPVPAEDDTITDLSDLESVLNALRPRGADYDGVTEAAGAYERGVQRLERGQVAEGLRELKEAARAPAFRFPAAARLGREYITQGHMLEGIEWLSRAADMPSPSRDAGLAVLYDLAGALESIGEAARALAVLMEIDADDAAYLDVPQRIEALSREEHERRG